MLGLAVVAAVTIGTVAIYYTLNGGDQLQIVDAPPQRRRRRSDVLQPPIQRRGTEMEFQNERYRLIASVNVTASCSWYFPIQLASNCAGLFFFKSVMVTLVEDFLRDANKE